MQYPAKSTILPKYCLSSTELTRLAELMLNGCESGLRTHRQHSTSKNSLQEQAVKKFRAVVERSDSFSIAENDDGSELKLVNLITKHVVPTEIQKGPDVETRGRQALGLVIDIGHQVDIF